jgi:hypothetical protein
LEHIIARSEPTVVIIVVSTVKSKRSECPEKLSESKGLM